MRQAKTRASKASCTVMRGLLGRVRAMPDRNQFGAWLRRVVEKP
jgi:hypothetical protein